MYDIFIMKIIPDDELNTRTTPSSGKFTRYYDSHLETINRCVQKAKTEYVWILSNHCYYTGFNFDFKPAPWESTQIHCFATNTQQQGDTFLIPVQAWKDQYPLERLEYFQDINYHYPGTYCISPRLAIYKHNLTTSITEHRNEWYTVFYSDQSDGEIDVTNDIVDRCTPSLWKDRAVYPLTKSGSISLVPKECNIKEHVYDYPYIDRSFQDAFPDEQQDIVFIDNGELCADQNYQTLLDITDPAGRSGVHRVQGINTRTKAYQAAAMKSKTPWFFAVFAKCEMNPDFDFNFQPDYFLEDRHYIFHATNPVNNLVYGHQAVILYNKNLVLNQNNPGLDFTMSDPVTVVPIISCTAKYNGTPEQTWRTAFREAIKLHHDVLNDYSIEAEFRLHQWKTIGNQEHGEYSIQGAIQGVQYYKEVNGYYPDLMKSFEWEWLHDRYKQTRTMESNERSSNERLREL